jgi:hypothetical protein
MAISFSTLLRITTTVSTFYYHNKLAYRNYLTIVVKSLMQKTRLLTIWKLYMINQYVIICLQYMTYLNLNLLEVFESSMSIQSDWSVQRREWIILLPLSKVMVFLNSYLQILLSSWCLFYYARTKIYKHNFQKLWYLEVVSLSFTQREKTVTLLVSRNMIFYLHDQTINI